MAHWMQLIKSMKQALLKQLAEATNESEKQTQKGPTDKQAHDSTAHIANAGITESD